jgi:hypothetical protein
MMVAIGMKTCLIGRFSRQRFLTIYNHLIKGIMMKTRSKHLKIIITLWMGSALPLSVFGQQVMVYPAQGQTPDQLSKDRYECHTWAVQQSGYDPSSAPASQPSTPQGSVGRETLRGGFRGAAAGAAIGAIAGDAGKGAAIGATAGGMKRAFGQIDANKAAPSSTGANDAANNYNRALGACLTGRGYSVQ